MQSPSKCAFAESLLGKISDAQANLLNQMAAKPISLEDKSDEDLKMIGVSSIDSLFNKIKIDEKGTREESTLARRHPDNSEGENLVEKIDKSGFEEVKTLTIMCPLFWITKTLIMVKSLAVSCAAVLSFLTALSVF